MNFLLALQLLIAAVSALTVRAPTIADDLKALVSTPSSVSIDFRARWSTFNAPSPAVVVNVTSEKDVAVVVGHSLGAEGLRNQG